MHAVMPAVELVAPVLGVRVSQLARWVNVESSVFLLIAFTL